MKEVLQPNFRKKPDPEGLKILFILFIPGSMVFSPKSELMPKLFRHFMLTTDIPPFVLKYSKTCVTTSGVRVCYDE